MSVRVKDLPEKPEQGTTLYCYRCDSKYSAERGDYFMYPATHVFECCGAAMCLVRMQTAYKILKE